MEIKIKKVHPNAVTPNFAHDGDAGLDLYTVVETTLEPGAQTLMSTGLAMAIPHGYVGLIWDKSGLAHKHGIKSLGGVIDAGYRGELMVGLMNLGKQSYTFAAGDKVAQLLIQKIEHPDCIEVDGLDDTSRGSGAFGSTGK